MMKKVDLTKGKVISVIFALALPIMGSSLLQFTYNLIDMMWVGSLGSNAVASIGASSLYINIGNAISSLAVIGTGIKTAHALGQKNNEKVSEYINAGIIVNMTIGLLFAMIILIFGRGFISFLSLNNLEVEKNAHQYLLLNAVILLFSFFNMLYTRVLSSFGNNKLAFRINGVGVILNIVLDPVCIYNLKLGVIGAGVSTLIANVIMFILFRKFSHGNLRYKYNIPLDFAKIKEIISLGIPMAFQRVLFTVINILLAKIVAVFGSDAIAAQKVGSQIEAISYMVIGGLNGAVAAFTGQNFGAGKIKRIKEGYKNSLIVGMSYALLMAVVFLTLNRPIIRLFIRDEATIVIAADYLKAVAFSGAFSAIEMISNGLFTGIGKPKIPAAISITFTAMRIPMALILIKPFGINGIWLSICLTSILKGACAYLIYKIKINDNYIAKVK